MRHVPPAAGSLKSRANARLPVELRALAPSLALALLTVAVLSPLALLSLALDGANAALVLASAAGWGAAPLRLVRQASRTALQRYCLATALGLAILAWLTLALGLAGWLSAFAARTLVAVGIGLGVVAIAQAKDSAGAARVDAAAPASAGRPSAQGASWTAALFWLPLAMPLAVLLLGATLPPGILWRDEARGYDVLEYHLQAPREWYDAGRVQFLPHNVYASFPQQVEILYLLLMHLAGGPLPAAVPAQLLHAGLGVLFVLALAAWTPAGGPRRIAALTAATVPWLVVVGSLAYVECGMLFFTTVAAGLLRDALQPRQRESVDPPAPPPPPDWPRLAAAGFCAGLACGCKYTAIALTAGGLGLSFLACAKRTLAERLRAAAVFALAAALAFAPWAARNGAWSGNPVYPFGYGVFGGRAWSDEQSAQWARGHRLPSADAHVGGRAAVALRELVGSSDAQTPLRPSYFGPAIVLLGVCGLAAARGRERAFLACWLALLLAAWALWTHMPGRFVLSLVIPLAWLAGSLGARAGGGVRQLATIAAWTLAGGSGLLSGWLLLDHLRDLPRDEVRNLPGATEAIAGQHVLNRVLPQDAYVWLVGDAAPFYVRRRLHYTVVFSRDPWLEFARQAEAEAALDWLARRGVTHVAFAWAEIERLRSTYGFADAVTRAWVESLARNGLTRVEIDPQDAAGGLEVYRVP